MHVGFEPSPVLGAKRHLGDTWKMLKWQFSGHMGGNPQRTRYWTAMAAAGSGTATCHRLPDGNRFAGRKIAGAMTTLVTGASGFLGSHVARLLIERGEQVRLLVCAPTSQTNCSTACRPSAWKAICAIPPRWTEHYAGVGTSSITWLPIIGFGRVTRARFMNPMLQGTRNLLEAARPRRRREVSSTPARSATWPCRARARLPDESTWTARSDEMIGAYKRSKWLAEQEANRRG